MLNSAYIYIDLIIAYRPAVGAVLDRYEGVDGTFACDCLHAGHVGFDDDVLRGNLFHYIGRTYDADIVDGLGLEADLAGAGVVDDVKFGVGRIDVQRLDLIF